MKRNRLRLAELAALFAAADEEDYEDSDDIGVLPGDQVKTLKVELKETKAQAKLAKKEREKGDWAAYMAEAAEIEKRLARHKALEDEARDLKKPRSTPRRSARRNLSPPPARKSIETRPAA